MKLKTLSFSLIPQPPVRDVELLVMAQIEKALTSSHALPLRRSVENHDPLKCRPKLIFPKVNLDILRETKLTVWFSIWAKKKSILQ